MIEVSVNDVKYFVNLNFNGESEILDQNKTRINEKINGDLYYEILRKSKGKQNIIVVEKRTIQETIEYLKMLSNHYAIEAHRNNDLISKGKSEAYEVAALEIEKNMMQ